MKNLTLILTLVLSCSAWAGFIGINGSTNLGVFNKLTCSTGLTCTKNGDVFSVISSPSNTSGTFSVIAPVSTAATFDLKSDNNGSNGDDWQFKSLSTAGGLQILNNVSGSQVAKLTMDTAGNTTIAGTLTVTGEFSPSAGVASSAATRKRWGAWIPGVASQGTSATPSATVVYLTQIWIPHNETITGIAVLNAATVGTNKYIVALFDSNGLVLANSTTAGVTTAGASVFQQIAFTGTYVAQGPRTYWVGVYVNGTTDRYFAIPTIGQAVGLAGSVSAQTFGTVAAVTLPTTFTADVGPIVYVY